MAKSGVNALEKVKPLEELLPLLTEHHSIGDQIVFTNGCFDLIHPGHVRYLERARALGDILIVAVNSDGSVRRLKGDDRPILSETDRCEIVAALHCVSYVTVFGEDTPLQIIKKVRPDILVKGGDWAKNQIVGRETVEDRGGRVEVIRFETGYSTTRLIEKIRATSCKRTI